MRNKAVGWVIIGIAALIGFIVWSFNRALTQIVADSCSHGPACPMWGSISFETNISLGITAFVALIGLYLIIFGDEKRAKGEGKEGMKTEPVPITKERYEKVLEKLTADEKNALEKVIEAQGTIFQSDLVEKTGFTKVKVTRILDRLEGQGVIERKRRGMTNVVILKP
jgi:uncharacterized membrane protein